MTTAQTVEFRASAQFNPVFRPVNEWRGRYRILKGSAGSGKSVNIAQDYIAKLSDPAYQGANLVVVRKIEETNRDSTFAELQAAIYRMFGPYADRFWKVNLNPLALECKITGNRIIFRGVKDQRQREKIKSITFKNGKLVWIWSIWSATNTTQKEETRMARFKSTITDRGAEVLTAFLAAGKRLVLVSAAAGDGVAQVSPNTLTALVNPINVNAQIGEKTFVESNPSYMRIPVQITNAGLESAQYVREVATFALDEKDAPFMFSYSWLDGADSDNILPPDSFLGRAGMDGEGDTVHIHDVAVVVTNQENSGITVEVGNGSFVTTAQMVAYSAPIVHGHAASDVQESTGESVESVQRRQDFDISAIREQLDTGFAGTAVTHTFATAQLNQWKGYDGTGLPEGILDTAKNRLYL